MLTGATSSSILSGVFSVFSYGLLFYYSWELALWAGATVLVLAAGTWFFATHQIRHQRAAFMAQGKIDGLVFQMILGVAKLRQAHAEVSALKRWSERYVEQKRAYLSARNWAAGQHAFNALYMPAVQIVLLGMIWYSLIEGETPTPFALGDFLSFHAAFGQFVGGATGLTAAWVTVVTVLPLFERGAADSRGAARKRRRPSGDPASVRADRVQERHLPLSVGDERGACGRVPS